MHSIINMYLSYFSRYATALRYIRYDLKCSCHMAGVYDKLVSTLLGRAGDCCFQLAQRWNQSDKESLTADYNNSCDMYQQIAIEMERDAHRITYIDGKPNYLIVYLSLESSVLF